MENFLFKTNPDHKILKNFTEWHILKLKMKPELKQERDFQLIFSD